MLILSFTNTKDKEKKFPNFIMMLMLELIIITLTFLVIFIMKLRLNTVLRQKIILTSLCMEMLKVKNKPMWDLKPFLIVHKLLLHVYKKKLRE